MLLDMWRSRQTFVAAVVLLVVVLVGVLVVVKDRVDGCLFCSGRPTPVFPPEMVGTWNGNYADGGTGIAMPITITIPAGGGEGTLDYGSYNQFNHFHCEDVIDAGENNGVVVPAHESESLSNGCNMAGQWTLQINTHGALVGNFALDSQLGTGTATLTHSG
jgi:hypothetical protein